VVTGRCVWIVGDGDRARELSARLAEELGERHTVEHAPPMPADALVWVARTLAGHGIWLVASNAASPPDGPEFHEVTAPAAVDIERLVEITLHDLEADEYSEEEEAAVAGRLEALGYL
jgi:hypothetical protein